MPVPVIGGLAAILGTVVTRLTLGSLVAGFMNGLRWLFLSRLGLFLGTAFVWLGWNFATINLLITPAVEALEAYSSSQSAGSNEYAVAMFQWLGVLKFDEALSMIISAVVTKHALMKGRLFLFKRGVGAPGVP